MCEERREEKKKKICYLIKITNIGQTSVQGITLANLILPSTKVLFFNQLTNIEDPITSSSLKDQEKNNHHKSLFLLTALIPSLLPSTSITFFLEIEVDLKSCNSKNENYIFQNVTIVFSSTLSNPLTSITTNVFEKNNCEKNNFKKNNFKKKESKLTICNNEKKK
jgi:hypothetical protein